MDAYPIPRVLVQALTVKRCQVIFPPFNNPTPWFCQNPTLLWSKSHPYLCSVEWDFGHKKVGIWQNQGVGLLKGGNLTCDPVKQTVHRIDFQGARNQYTISYENLSPRHSLGSYLNVIWNGNSFATLLLTFKQ